MATRYLRNTVVLAKIESTYGTDSTPTEAANAVLLSNVEITPLKSNNVDRALIRPYMGGSEQLLGALSVELTFEVELAGSGTAGTAPAYAPLLRACGFVETLTASVRAEYNLTTPVTDSITIYGFWDGAKHILRGCRGNVAIALSSGGRPLLKFKFEGLDGGTTAASPSTVTLTSWKTPLVVYEPNTGDVTLSCTYTAATPTLTGGTSYPSKGLEIDLGNSVNHIPLLGGESVEITDRSCTGTMQLDLTAAQEVSFLTAVKANTTQSVGLMHGTVAGNKAMVFLPNVQLINPKKVDLTGKLMIGFDMRILPSAGNDELKIVIH